MGEVACRANKRRERIRRLRCDGTSGRSGIGAAGGLRIISSTRVGASR
jgi:hypothetical protein